MHLARIGDGEFDGVVGPDPLEIYSKYWFMRQIKNSSVLDVYLPTFSSQVDFLILILL